MAKQKYKNRKYEITVVLPLDADGNLLPGVSLSNSVNIINKPFIMKKLTHEIIGENGLAAAFPNNMIQDGQYLLEWRSDQYNYQTAPISAGAGYGTVYDHFELDTPEELKPKTTITAKITNNVLRDEALTIQLVFHGLEPIGESRQS